MLSVAILVFTDKEVWQDAESLCRPRRGAGGKSGYTWLSQPNNLEMHIARKLGGSRFVLQTRQALGGYKTHAFLN